MYKKKECVAMLLAGGQGSRLYDLTAGMAKPAVPFGGKYRIIDFTLSNCVNSGIDTVGVLTQYQPLALNEYIGDGQPWDLDRTYGGATVLPPYQTALGSFWYKGTANAIYHNMGFIDRYEPEYVIILSGDHIYKMNYDEMLDFHKEKDADCTIAVLTVSLEEASRFGIMNADENSRIHEFEEKPKNPKSTLASMGVYIFKWSKLKQYLVEDEKNSESSNDFGKNIIPAMLQKGERMFAFGFEGYWKDVGTVDSLWDANMDLLYPNVTFELNDPDWKIYARNPMMPPHYISKDAEVQNSMVAEGAEIYGDVENSVISTGVLIEEGAKVEYSVIMPNAVIEKGAQIRYAIVGEGAVVRADVIAGARPEETTDITKWKIAVIGPGFDLSENRV